MGNWRCCILCMAMMRALRSLLAEILKLINEQSHGNLAFPGRFCDSHKKIGQVAFQIATVRRPFFRRSYKRLDVKIED